MARLFVGVPTRNRPELVPDTLKSLASQTFTDFRAIVSDNASDPAASEAVADYVRDLGDERLCYHLQPEDVKEYGQGRFFFAECEEDYFAIVHDDDWLDPSYFQIALRHLDDNPWASCFVANPFIFTRPNEVDARLTANYLEEHGRHRYPEGRNQILEPLLSCGLIPISGTVFRTSALRESGFVDEDCHGNYPFELNLFLRLGEAGAEAYFSKEQLLGFRYHPGSLRSTLRLKFNEHVVATVVKLLERRRFDGRSEDLRRRTLAYNLRNHAMILLVRGERQDALDRLARARQLNPMSYRNWTYSAAALLCPSVLRRLLRSRVVLTG